MVRHEKEHAANSALKLHTLPLETCNWCGRGGESDLLDVVEAKLAVNLPLRLPIPSRLDSSHCSKSSTFDAAPHLPSSHHARSESACTQESGANSYPPAWKSTWTGSCIEEECCISSARTHISRVTIESLKAMQAKPSFCLDQTNLWYGSSIAEDWELCTPGPSNWNAFDTMKGREDNIDLLDDLLGELLVGY